MTAQLSRRAATLRDDVTAARCALITASLPKQVAPPDGVFTPEMLVEIDRAVADYETAATAARATDDAAASGAADGERASAAARGAQPVAAPVAAMQSAAARGA